MKNQDIYSLETMESLEFINFYELFNGVLFWIKDTKGRFLHANKSFLSHFSIGSLNEIVGKDISNIHRCKKLAHSTIEEEKKIVQGKQIHDRLVLNISSTGEFSWYITNSRPIWGDSGEINGSIGVSIPLNKYQFTNPKMDSLFCVLGYILENHKDKLKVETLADIACISISSLERRFKKYLHKSPQQFIFEVRLGKAHAMLINSSYTIAKITEETGFSDHSYFSKKFSEYYGYSPITYREKHTQI